MKPLLKILKSYGAPTDDLLEFYCLVIRLILEYGVAIWTMEPRILKRALGSFAQIKTMIKF